MKVYLETCKIQKLRRISIGPAALRNIECEIGSSIEIHFDPENRCLIIKPINNSKSIESFKGIKNDSGVVSQKKKKIPIDH